MSRRYADPIAVRLVPTAENDIRPVGFRWRGRSYAVTAVLARWVEAGAWWRDAVPAGLGPGSKAAARKAREPRKAASRRSAAPAAVANAPSRGTAAEPTGSSGAAVPASGVTERVVWRVEAIRHRGRTGVFDLCRRPGPGPPLHDAARDQPDRWFLVRALD